MLDVSGRRGFHLMGTVMTLAMAMGCSHGHPLLSMPAGIGGMAPIDADTYFVVHDFKDDVASRFGLVVLEGGRPSYEPVGYGWKGRIVDLEGACVVPGSRGTEFL